MNKFAIIDLETTGNSPAKGDRIIEIGVVVWKDGEIIQQYDRLINPNVHISRFITYLTGITNESVIHEPTFEMVAREVRALFNDAYFVAHNVPFDLGFLNAELKRVGLAPLTQPVIDTVELARILLPTAPGFKLGQLADWLSFQHQNPHRALSDAYVTTELLSRLIDKVNNLPLRTIEILAKIEPNLKSNLATILATRQKEAKSSLEEDDRYEVVQGLAIKKMPLDHKVEHPTSIESFGAFLDQLFSNNGRLASEMDNYEARAGQREMAEHIYHIFQSEQHGIIEAETGTGKSLAYLIAGIYQAVSTNDRIIISTYLTLLQSQLMDHEIPLLKKVVPFPFTVVVLKGKQHYLSLKKFSETLRYHKTDNYDQVLTKAILLVWLTETKTGDIDEIQLPTSGQRFFRMVSSEAEGQLQPTSDPSMYSFYQRARERALSADLVITNHALLCTNMTHEDRLLPEFDKVIVDEAHHLAASTGQHFGLQLDYVSCLRILTSTEKLFSTRHHQIGGIKNDSDLSLFKETLQAAKEETDTLFRYLFHFVKGKQEKDRNINDTGRYQYTIVEEDSSDWRICLEMVSRLRFLLRDLTTMLEALYMQMEGPDRERFLSKTDELEALSKKLHNYFYLTSANDRISWVEIEATGAQNAVFLFQQPIDVAKVLKEQLFDKRKSVVLTSASISVKKSFDHFKTTIGLNDLALIEHKLPSPYHYEDQVRVLIPNDFPIAKYQAMDPFIEATCEAVFSLAEVTKGRMLILFTSYDMLKKAYKILREILADDYVIIAQGISSGSRERLKKNFQTFDQSILLGTNSFWEGIDIPGSDLSCVVIVRLPFESPNHPVYQVKSEQLKKKGKNPFMDLSLPNAVIRFKQGFGRLIRSTTDRGIIFICDDRIMTAKYGKYFIDSVPKVPIHYRSINELLEIAQIWL